MFKIKRIKILEERIERLYKTIEICERSSNNYLKRIDDLKATNDELNQRIKDLNDKLSELTITNDNLERERDILYQYYDLNKEPTQDVKTQMRINKRVYDLELENIRLNALLESTKNSYVNFLQSSLTYAQTMNPQCQITQYPYIWR